MSQPSLFPAELSASAHVAGFAYWPDAFTAVEERDWLRKIEALPFKPFEFRGYLGKRSGPARHEWEHSIPPVESTRYSVTFRTFVEDRRLT